jgi:hypothetical protein
MNAGLTMWSAERGDQRLGLLRVHALDPGAIVAHDVEAFAAGPGMRPDDRMAHRRVAVDLLLGRRKGALAADEVEDRAAIDPPFSGSGKRVPRRLGAGEFGVAERQAVQIGDFMRIEHRAARRPSRVAHVAVPVLAGAAHADRLAVLGDVRHDDDLRAARHAPALAERC